MFYYISGDLVLTDRNCAVIDAGGVGYKLIVPGSTIGKLTAAAERKVKLYTYMAVREDAVDLYGFYTTEELNSFKLLISVSGVGAKSAISILTLLSPERFALAVTTGDAKAISKASGIGAKTAARIILELKDKLAKQITSENVGDLMEGGVSGEAAGSKLGEAQNALLVLGYSRSEAIFALKDVSPDAELEDMIRDALRKLMKN